MEIVRNSIEGDSADESATGLIRDPCLRSDIDDPIGDYYIHHSDPPGIVLVSHLLNGDNYMSRSRSMKIALSTS